MGAFGVFRGMVLKQLFRVLHRYDTELGERVETRRFRADNSPYTDAANQISHARWMCQEIMGFLPRHKIDEPPPDSKETQAAMEKAMRWFGFVQGLLWSTGIKTLDEIHEDNRDPAREQGQAG